MLRLFQQLYDIYNVRCDNIKNIEKLNDKHNIILENIDYRFFVNII